jgi:capsular exopolysaccharide synthesis family protein
MNVERAEETEWNDVPDMRDALIAHSRLSQPDVARIMETMRETGLNFCEAALQLKLATREAIYEVLVRERERLGRQQSGGGLFETALRQVSPRRDLILRQGLAKPSRELLYAQDGPRGEKIRGLRTELMLLNDSSQRGNVIALVSPERHEGRSQLCAELAVAFAQLGRRTLLVDADLRHPRQHVLFGADNQQGLAQALAVGESPFLHAVDGMPELSLITSGTVPPNPLELVSHRRFERLLTSLRRQYDFVVVDTPAMTPYSDAQRIATIAERVLVVSRAESTTMQSMKDMLGRLAVTDSRILGAVISRF